MRLRVPVRPLHPSFIQAYRHAEIALRPLAAAAGFSHPSQLSRLLNAHAQQVSASARTVKRLTTLASVLDYDGPIFGDRK
jgi:hypothetical protein